MLLERVTSDGAIFAKEIHKSGNKVFRRTDMYAVWFASQACQIYTNLIVQQFFFCILIYAYRMA